MKGFHFGCCLLDSGFFFHWTDRSLQFMYDCLEAAGRQVVEKIMKIGPKARGRQVISKEKQIRKGG